MIKLLKIEENAKNTIKEFNGNNDIKFLEYDNECTYSHIVALVENRNDWIEATEKNRNN